MDHMGISGNKLSSVILSQTKWFQKLKLKMMNRKCLNKVKPNKMVYLTHKITISRNFNTENFDTLKTQRINRSRQWNLVTCALVDSLVFNVNMT